VYESDAPSQPPPLFPPQKKPLDRGLQDSTYLSLYSYFFFPLHFSLACSSWGCSGQGILRVRYMMKIPTQEGE